jgi:hypothetical protein
MQTFYSPVKFTEQAETNLIKINGGQVLQRVKYTQASINFGSISGHSTVTQTVTFTGATVAKVNFVQVKQPSGIDEAVVFCAGVSADDTVLIRAHNTKNAGVTVATATYDVLLTQFND